MASSVMDAILALVTPDLRQAIASRLGESAQTVQSGLSATTAATLGGLAAKAADRGFLSQIMNVAATANTQNVLGSLTATPSGAPSDGIAELADRFLSMVLGAQQGEIASAIAQHASLSASSVNSLLKMAALLVLAFLGRAQASGSLTAGSLGSLLRAEAPSLPSYLPFGLVSNPAGGVAQGAGAVAADQGAGPAPSRWLVPLVMLGALTITWLMFRSMNSPKGTAQSAAYATSSAPSAAGTAAHSARESLGEIMAVKLPDGSSLHAPGLGMEARLVKYLDEGTVAVSDENWFDFDRLLFDTGQATLQPQSQEQLNNVAAILKAYPKVRARLGGYTDDTGDAASNLVLSEARANTVMRELIRLGADPARLEARGYGEEHPAADNATEEGRQKNLRISLVILQK
jgi:outer membrane protein OmpA-like peptidoglycan-associated protein